MKSKFIPYIYSLCFFAGGLVVSGCSDLLDDSVKNNESDSGYVSFQFNVADAVTRGNATITGQVDYNENTVNYIDLFFYDDNVGDDTPAKRHLRVNNIAENTALVSVKDLSEGQTSGAKNFKVLAVANCRETSANQLNASLGTETPSLNQLKGIVTRADASNTGSNVRAFRADEAPEDFVMINFHNKTMADITIISVDFGNNTKATVSLRRVAAKIRVAIKVVESYEDADGVTWTPDLSDCRIFFTNGVRTARLDGDVTKLTLNDAGEDYASSDYYSIATSGAKETEDYYYARPVTSHESSDLTGKVSEDYKWYNDLPLYTYPSKWKDDMFETHRPMAIVVIEWKKESDDGDEQSFEYSYYSMPINPKGEIVSNAYYFLRANIAMMGSSSPQRPLEIEAETEILDWGSAPPTTADMRPLRFLQVNQNEFIVNNETTVSIPFYSSHNVEDFDLSGFYYVIHGYRGLPQKRYFDSEVKVNDGRNQNRDKLYKIEIDNKKKVITFIHHFFDIWSTTPNLNSNYSSAGSEVKVTEFTVQPQTSSESTTVRKLYAQVFVEFKIRHKDQPQNDEYEETIKLTLNPSIYVSTLSDYERLTNGGILLNGYGSTNGTTGQLGGFTGNAGDDYANYLTVVTVSQLNEDDAVNWILDDPRTNYINNDMSNDSMDKDYVDQMDYWTTNGGPYGQTGVTNSTQKGSGVWRMIWEDYPMTFPDWQISWTLGEWSPKNDADARTLKYYYPAAENSDKYKVIAPKMIWNSRHATNRDQTSITEARRRCATFQQAGYPAGRWRLPTEAEFAFMKKMKRKDVTQPIFGGVDYWTNNGDMDGSNTTEKAAGNNRSTSNNWARCVYDAWYWELVDEEGESIDNRIPNPDNWMIFTYGDRPRENYISTRDGSINKNAIDRYLQKHGRGVYVVIRDGDDVRLEKVEQ